MSIPDAIWRYLAKACEKSKFALLPMKIELPAEGIEPTRSCDHWILSPARLPVPPRRQKSYYELFTIVNS
jgi:hypothetical protein